jgi:threonine dehydratase
VLIGIETKHAENFPVLKQRFDAAGLRYQDITENEMLANFVI